MDFGRTLRLLRIDAGISLRAMARNIGVSGAYLSRVENGHDPPPTSDRLVAIARTLRVPPVLLLGLAHQTENAITGYLQRVPALAQLVLRIAELDLDATQVARILRFVDAEFPPRRAVSAQRLHPLLAPERIALRITCEDRGDLLGVVAAKLASGEPGSSTPLIRALAEREREAASELGEGLLVPHAALPGASCRAALVTLAQPLVIEPARPGISLALGLVYDSQVEPPLALLAHVAHFAERDAIAQLCACTSPAQALRTLTELEASW